MITIIKFANLLTNVLLKCDKGFFKLEKCS